MFQYQDEVPIDTSPEKIFHFLTRIDSLYHIWHPKDHIFCKTLKGSLEKEGGIFYFFEWIGKFPLFLIAHTTKVERNKFIEYEPAFPLSLFKFGYAYFKVEQITKTQSRLVAFVQVGSKIKLIDRLLTFLIQKLLGVDSIHKHIREEGLNIKNYLEYSIENEKYVH